MTDDQRPKTHEVARRRIAACIAGVIGIVAVACSSASGPGVQLTIRKGSSFREAAESLSAHGLVRSVRVFSLYAKVRNRDRSLRWGTYVLRPGMSWEQMLDALRLGRGVIHEVTIPEGLSIADVEPLLIDALDLTQDSLDVAVRDTALLHELDAAVRFFDSGDLLRVGKAFRRIHAIQRVLEQQVDVLDVVLDGVGGDRLGQRHFGAGRVDVKSQDGVLAVLTDHTGELERRQGQVLRVGTVAVEHRGDLACAASTASGALAELGTRLGGETDLGHGGVLLG